MSVHEGREYYMGTWRCHVAHIISLAPMKIQGGKTYEEKRKSYGCSSDCRKSSYS